MLRTKISIAVLMAMAVNAVALAASPARSEQRARAAMRLSADAAEGRQLYERNCAGCHGREAHGDMIRLVPALAGQRRAYLIKHVVELNDAERAASHMHPRLQTAELAAPQGWVDLAEYLQQSPPLPVAASDNEHLIEHGARSYRRWCASCHGADAGGKDAQFVPSLRHQHREYLLKELRMVSSAHRLSLDSEAISVLDGLNVESTAGIVDYVSRIGVAVH